MIKKEFFVRKLLDQYNKTQRDLPWRKTKDPYCIWLSEIILQQTRVGQGLPYYEKFIENYETVFLLAEADEEEVLRLWQGLGYYSRARNMHKTARKIVNDFAGKFPDNYHDLLQLSGVGSYTAAAIASIAFNESVPVVDGNVFRVVSRVFGVFEDISTLRGKKVFFETASRLIPKKYPGDFNQALMEFGALTCTPKSPLCSDCVFNAGCFAYNKDSVHLLPVKTKKIKSKTRYFYYVIFKKNGKIFLKKRENNDIWKNLYEFYLIERDSEVEFDELTADTLLQAVLKKGGVIGEVSGVYKHVLSHRIIYAVFHVIHLPEGIDFDKFFIENNLQACDVKEAESLPKPVLINNYLTDHFF